MSNLKRQRDEGYRGSLCDQGETQERGWEVIGGTTSWEDKRPQRGYGLHLPEAPNKAMGLGGAFIEGLS